MSTGIKKVSFGSIDNQSYKVEFENGEICFAPIAEGNRHYQMVQTYLKDEGGIIEEYEFALKQKQDEYIAIVKAKKESVKVLKYIVDSTNTKIIPITDKILQLVKDKGLQAKVCKEMKIPFSFALLDEKTGEEIFKINSDYSKDTVPFDCFLFMFSLLNKIENSLLSVNYVKCLTIIKEVQALETVVELEDYIEAKDLNVEFVDGIILKLSDFQ